MYLHSSNTSDQVMNLPTHCLQDHQEMKTVAQKRKAEDFFVNVDNVNVQVMGTHSTLHIPI